MPVLMHAYLSGPLYIKNKLGGITNGKIKGLFYNNENFFF